MKDGNENFLYLFYLILLYSVDDFEDGELIAPGLERNLNEP
jgi:hypothetical protein